MNSLMIMASIKMDSCEQQTFAVPSTILRYILKSSSSSYISIIKLYKTCKYFFMKKKVFFIRDFYHQYDYEYFLFNGFHPKSVMFWFAKNLTIFHCFEMFPSHQIYRCTIKKFFFSHSSITLSDFLIIVKENTIKDFVLTGAFIKNLDGTNMSLDFVLKNLPNVEYFIYSNSEVTINQEQLQNIGTINLWNQLQKFNINIIYVSKFFDPLTLVTFFKNNAALTSKSQIIVDGINSEQNYNNLKTSFEEMVQTYEIEIYHIEVPFEILRERLRKSCEAQKAAQNNNNNQKYSICI